MEWFALLVRLIDALAWPVAIVVLVLVFRRPILDRIPDLLTLRTPGGFEASFARKVSEAERRAESVIRVSEIDVEPPTEEREGPAPDLEFLAETFPRGAVVESWVHVEQELERVAERVEIQPPRRGSMIRLIRELRERDLLGPTGAALINDLRTLRNNAAHAPDFDISVEAASAYVRTVLLVLEMLRSLPGHSVLAVPLDVYESMTEQQHEEFRRLDPKIILGEPARYKSPDGRTWAIFSDPRLAPTTAARIEELLGCPVVRSGGVPRHWRPIESPEE